MQITQNNPNTLSSVFFFFLISRVSYLEIYNETMFDLLSTLPETSNAPQVGQMTVLEDESGCYVKGLSCHLAQNEEEALNLLFEVYTCPYTCCWVI